MLDNTPDREWWQILGRCLLWCDDGCVGNILTVKLLLLMFQWLRNTFKLMTIWCWCDLRLVTHGWSALQVQLPATQVDPETASKQSASDVHSPSTSPKTIHKFMTMSSTHFFFFLSKDMINDKFLYIHSTMECLYEKLECGKHLNLLPYQISN